MSITDNAALAGLEKARQDARAKLSRQTEATKATIALIKLLDEAIANATKTK